MALLPSRHGFLRLPLTSLLPADILFCPSDGMGGVNRQQPGGDESCWDQQQYQYFRSKKSFSFEIAHHFPRQFTIGPAEVLSSCTTKKNKLPCTYEKNLYAHFQQPDTASKEYGITHREMITIFFIKFMHYDTARNRMSC